LTSSTLVGHCKPSYEEDKKYDEKLRKMIMEAARGSEYSRKEGIKVKECEAKVRKYKTKIAFMKSQPNKWMKLEKDVNNLIE
jgi:hypothetical protein